MMEEFLMPTSEKRPLIKSYYGTTEHLSISYGSTELLDTESFHGNGLADGTSPDHFISLTLYHVIPSSGVHKGFGYHQCPPFCQNFLGGHKLLKLQLHPSCLHTCKLNLHTLQCLPVQYKYNSTCWATQAAHTEHLYTVTCTHKSFITQKVEGVKLSLSIPRRHIAKERYSSTHS
jgi:hypothetical protein